MQAIIFQKRKILNLTNKKINFCIISSEENLKQVNIEINRYLHSKDISLDLGKLSFDKFDRIKKYFEFSDDQILTVLSSYGYNSKNAPASNCRTIKKR